MSTDRTQDAIIMVTLLTKALEDAMARSGWTAQEKRVTWTMMLAKADQQIKKLGDGT